MDEIIFNGKKFSSRLDAFVYICKIENNNFPVKLFLHSDIYYVRAHLEEKFKREFSLKEVQKMTLDKSWQWCTSPQTLTNEKGELETQHAK